ncbi:helix-turn-helix domain-containing protein [bacterium]|nr:helix-turn-helix domain-containing protein [bacterium]
MNEELKSQIKAAVREAMIEAGILLGYDGWFDKAEAADYCKMSPSSLDSLIKKRAIPYHQRTRGSKILFRKSELDEWIARPRSGSLKETIRRIRGK